MLLTYVAIDNAIASHAVEQGIGQTGSIHHKIGEGCRSIGTDNHAIGEARCIYDIDIRENRVHRLCQCLYQPKICTRAPCVDDRYPRWGEMVAYLLEEFLCCQLKRYIRLLVRIDCNHIIFMRTGLQ